MTRSSFLDQRIAADLSTARNVPIDEVLDSPIDESLAAPAFIFHTAFCCSTLLAHSLDLPKHTLVLREPSTLLQLADMKRGLNTTKYRPAEFLEPTLNLLSRPLASDERVLIKPTNLVNNLIPELLSASPESRVLVLYDDMEAFLLSVLKRPRESLHGITQFLERLRLDLSARTFAPEVLNVGDLPRRAALAWTLQLHTLNAWLSTSPNHVRLLSAPQLLREPVPTLTAVASWLNLKIDATAHNTRFYLEATRQASRPALHADSPQGRANAGPQPACRTNPGSSHLGCANAWTGARSLTIHSAPDALN